MKKMISGLVMMVGMALGMGQMVGAYTCPSGTVREGDNVESAAICNTETDSNAGNSEGLTGIIKNVINFLMGIAGVIAVFVVIIGGINLTTSQGDPGKVKKAREMILWGLVGLVVALLAFAIVNFALVNVF